MTNIVLDSNIWIYLTKDNFFELWIKLKEARDNGEIELIVNDTIIKEWNRNKSNTINSLVNNIKSEYKSAIKLGYYLNENDRKEYIKIISQYKNEERRIQSATDKVEEIEKFMLSCKTLITTTEQKLFIAQLAIDKLPPFQNNKNNFNDALILRNICEFADNQVLSLYDLIYVSNNPDDFLDKKTGEPHASMLEGLKPIRLKNVTELGEALKLAPELIEDFDQWLDIQLNNQAMYELDVIRGK